MADIFDSTRRKISKHISKEIAPEVFATKNQEFREKVNEILIEYLQSPKCKQKIENVLQWAAMEHIQKYFYSREFKKRCLEVAKGMVK